MKLLPSEYFRRNVFLTYITDHIGLNNIRYTGSDHFMWSSDYPHGAALWPHSADYVSSSAAEAGLDAGTVENLTVRNAARLYDIDLDVVSEPSPLLSGAVR
jgi:hypothetical protein